MKTLNETILAIVLEKGSKISKINRIVKETGLTRKNAEKAFEGLSFVYNLSAVNKTDKSKSFTIGVEIECYNINKHEVAEALAALGIKSISTGYNHNDSKDTYKLGADGSINGVNSCEIVTPILKNLSSLRKVCDVINRLNAKVNKSCGLHVHFGIAHLNVEVVKRIVLNYANAEAAIDTFMSKSRRANENHYCQSSIYLAERINVLGSTATTIDSLARLQGSRYCKVNLLSYLSHKTIEFRQHQGTTDMKKIENWVSFLKELIIYSMDNKDVISRVSRIEDIPWMSESQKNYYKTRRNELSRE